MLQPIVRTLLAVDVACFAHNHNRHVHLSDEQALLSIGA
jgi:hypothetical protein